MNNKPKYEREYVSMLSQHRSSMRVAATDEEARFVLIALRNIVEKSNVLEASHKDSLKKVLSGIQSAKNNPSMKVSLLTNLRGVINDLNINVSSESHGVQIKLEQTIMALEDIYKTIKEF